MAGDQFDLDKFTQDSLLLYEDEFGSPKEMGRLHVDAATSQDASEYRRDKRNANKLGVPSEVLKGSPDLAAKRLREFEVNSHKREIEELHPDLNRWLSESPQNLAASQDDLGNLKKMSSTAQLIDKGWDAGWAQVELGDLYWQRLLNRLGYDGTPDLTREQEARVKYLEYQMEQGAFASEESNAWQYVGVETAKVVPQIWETFSGAVRGGGILAGTGAVLGGIGGGLTVGPAGIVPGAWGGVMALGGKGATAGSILEIIQLEAGLFYHDMSKMTIDGTPGGEKVPDEVAIEAALWVGGINSGLEMIGLGSLFRVFMPGKRAMTSELVKRMVASKVGETAAKRAFKKYAETLAVNPVQEMAQEVTNSIFSADVASKAWGIPNDGPLSVIAQDSHQILEAGKAGFAGTMLLPLPGMAGSVGVGAWKNKRSNASASKLDRLNEVKLESKLAKEDERTFNQASAEVLENHEPVYVSAVELVNRAQENPSLIDEVIMRLDGMTPQSLAEKAEAGLDVEISAAEWMSHIAGTEHHENLRRWAKRDPGFDSPGEMDAKANRARLSQRDGNAEVPSGASIGDKFTVFDEAGERVDVKLGEKTPGGKQKVILPDGEEVVLDDSPSATLENVRSEDYAFKTDNLPIGGGAFLQGKTVSSLLEMKDRGQIESLIGVLKERILRLEGQDKVSEIGEDAEFDSASKVASDARKDLNALEHALDPLKERAGLDMAELQERAIREDAIRDERESLENFAYIQLKQTGKYTDEQARKLASIMPSMSIMAHRAGLSMDRGLNMPRIEADRGTRSPGTPMSLEESQFTLRDEAADPRAAEGAVDGRTFIGTDLTSDQKQAIRKITLDLKNDPLLSRIEEAEERAFEDATETGDRRSIPAVSALENSETIASLIAGDTEQFYGLATQGLPIWDDFEVQFSQEEFDEAARKIRVATQEILEIRGLPDEFLVYRAGNLPPGAEVGVSLDYMGARGFAFESFREESGTVKVFRIKKSDVSADIHSLFSGGFTGEENELLINADVLLNSQIDEVDALSNREYIAPTSRAADGAEVTVFVSPSNQYSPDPAPEVGLAKVGEFESGIEIVKTAEDVAHVVSPLRLEAQENLVVVVADDAGKVLGVIRVAIGSLASVPVDFKTMLGPVFSKEGLLEGASQMWFVHNHPGGMPDPSPADRKVWTRLSSLVEGTGIKLRSGIIVAPGNVAGEFAGPKTSDPFRQFDIPESPRERVVGVFARRFVRETSAKDTKRITGERSLRRLTKPMRDAEESGLMLLDQRHTFIGFLPMTVKEMRRLRTDDRSTGAGAILSIVNDVNASAVVPIIPTRPELQYEPAASTVDDKNLESREALRAMGWARLIPGFSDSPESMTMSDQENALINLKMFTTSMGIRWIGHEGQLKTQDGSVSIRTSQAIDFDGGVTDKDKASPLNLILNGIEAMPDEGALRAGLKASYEFLQGPVSQGEDVLEEVPQEEVDKAWIGHSPKKKYAPQTAKEKKDKKRKVHTGYFGAPDWVKNAKSLKKLKDLLHQLVREGESGRYWYENSAEWVLRIVGGDLVEAEKVVELLAIYSPQSEVTPNTIKAIRAYVMFKNGMKREDFHVGTGDQDSKAIGVLYDEQPFPGVKTKAFYRNMMVPILRGRTLSEIDRIKIDNEILMSMAQDVTADIWVFRAFGYSRDAASGDKGEGKYTFAENLLRKVTAEVNKDIPSDAEPWTAWQIQAAIWTAIKSRFEYHEPGATVTKNLRAFVKGKTKNAKGRWVDLPTGIASRSWVKQKTMMESYRKGLSFLTDPSDEKGKSKKPLGELEGPGDLLSFGDFSGILSTLLTGSAPERSSLFKGSRISTPTKAADKGEHILIWRKHALTVKSEDAKRFAEENGYDFGTVLQRMSMMVPWEAQPAPALNSPILQASADVQSAFMSVVNEILRGPNGEDLLALAIGSPLSTVRPGEGGFAEAVSPNMLSELTPDKPAGRFDYAIANVYATAIQYIFKQEAVPWMRFDSRVDVSKEPWIVRKVGSSNTLKKFESISEARAELARRVESNPSEDYEIVSGSARDRTNAIRKAEERLRKATSKNRKAREAELIRAKGTPVYSAGYLITSDRELSQSESEEFYHLMRVYFGDSIGYTRSGPGEYVLINFRDEETGLPNPFAGPALDDEQFQSTLKQFLASTGGTYGIQAEIEEIGVEARYIDHDWSGDPSGEGILNSESLAGSPDLQQRLRDWRLLYEGALESFEDGDVQAAVDRAARADRQIRDERDRSDGQGLEEHTSDLRRLGLLDEASGTLSFSGDAGGVRVPLEELHRGQRVTQEAARSVYRALGIEVEPGRDTNDLLKIYPLEKLGETEEEVQSFIRSYLDDIGWEVRYFGPKAGEDGRAVWPRFVDPNTGELDPDTPTYEDGTIWIFDPREEGGSFRDNSYTLAWRVSHELAHARTNEYMTRKYGNRGRRGSSLGKILPGAHYKPSEPMSLAGAMRSIEWEFVAFHFQRKIIEEDFGISITDEEFAKEHSINLADAVYRAITAQFGDPGDIGVIPTATDPYQQLQDSFTILRQVAAQTSGDRNERFPESSRTLFQTAAPPARKSDYVLSPEDAVAQNEKSTFDGETGKWSDGLFVAIGDAVKNSEFWDMIVGVGQTPSKSALDSWSNWKRLGKVRANRRIPEGNKVRLRIDVSFFESRGMFAVTVDDTVNKSGKTVNPESGAVGVAIGYDDRARLSGPVEFKHSERVAQQILQGEKNKRPIAVVEGNISQDRSKPGDIDDWIPVGYNPHKATFFYDKRNGREVLAGTDSISIGNTVYVREILEEQYGPRTIEVVEPQAPTRAETSDTQMGALNEQVLKDEEEKLAEDNSTLRQGARGGITFDELGNIFIRLGETSDKSTFLHEAGHLFLEQMRTLVSRGANEEFVEDWRTVLKWFGDNSSSVMSWVKSNEKDLVRDFGRAAFDEVVAGGDDLITQRATLGDVSSRDGSAGIIATGLHELWAEAFEKYLETGKAPSTRLKNAFRSFSEWLKSVYENIRRRDIDLPAEIVEVMDRMLSTDEEMASAEQDLMHTEIPGLSMEQDDRVNYLELIEKARAEAREEHNAKKEKIAARKAQKQWRKSYAEELERAIDELRNQPIYQADAWLRRGEWIGQETPEEDAQPEPTKLSQKIIKGIYGKEARTYLSKLGGGRSGRVQKVGGIHPDQVAEMFGAFEGDGQKLITELLTMRPLKERAKEMAEAAMHAKFGSPEALAMASIDETAHTVEAREKVLRAEMVAISRARSELREAAQREVAAEGPGSASERVEEVRSAQAELKAASEANDEERIQRALVALESARTRQDEARRQREIGRVRGRQEASVEGEVRRAASALRDKAEEDVRGSTKIGALRPDLYRSGEQKAAREVRLAVRRGEWDKAEEAMRRRVYNYHAYRFALEAKRDQLRYLKDLTRYLDVKVRKRIGKVDEQIMNAIDQILEQFDFRRSRSAKHAMSEGYALDQIERLELTGAMAHAASFIVGVRDESGAWIQRPVKKSYKALSVNELSELRDTIKSLAHNAIQQEKYQAWHRSKYLESARDTFDEAHRESKLKDRRTSDNDLKEFRRKRQNMKDRYVSIHTKPEWLFHWMDGGEYNGKIWKLLYKPFSDAGDWAALKMNGINKELRSIYEDHYDRTQMARWIFGYESATIPNVFDAEGKPLRISKVKLLSIALNSGTKNNRDAVLDTRGWDESQLDAVLDALDENDWQFVRKVWKLINSLWPESSNLQQRSAGVRPKAEKGIEIRTRYGTFTGQYFPIAFDPKTDPRIKKAQEDKEASGLFGSSATRAMTKQGHLIERQKHTGRGRKLLLDLDVIDRHLKDVVHDLAFREAIVEVNRLVRDKEIEKSAKATVGAEMWSEVGKWIDAVANSGSSPNQIGSSLIRYMRSGVSIVAMGFKMSTALFQPLGYTMTVKHLGHRYAGVGLKEFFGPGVSKPHKAKKQMDEVMEFVYSMSDFMKTRGANFDVAIKGAMESVGPRAMLREIDEASFKFIGLMQMAVDVPTWLGAYAKAMDGNVDNVPFGSQEDAAAFADSVVRLSQSHGDVKDLAAIQRQGDFIRLFTQFYGFFSSLWNNLADELGMTHRARDIMRPRTVANLIWMLIVPAVLEEWLRSGTLGPDEEEEHPIFTSVPVLSPVLWSVKEGATFGLGSVLFLGDIVQSIESGYGYEITSVGSPLKSATQLAKQISQGDADRAMWKAFSDTVGYATRLPTGAMFLYGESIHSKLTSPHRDEITVREMMLGVPKEKRN